MVCLYKLWIKCLHPGKTDVLLSLLYYYFKKIDEHFWRLQEKQVTHFRRSPKISNNFRRFPDDFQRLPKISRQLPKITEGVERFSTTSKQGQRFPKDFQPISSIIPKMFFSPKKKWNFYLIGFEQSLHSLLSVRHEELVWMREMRSAAVTRA